MCIYVIVKNYVLGAGEMVQSVKGLLCKHKDMNSDLSTHTEAGHSTAELKIGRFLGLAGHLV